MTPKECYQVDVAKEGFSYDPAQDNVVAHMQRLYNDLIANQQQTKGLFQSLMNAPSAPQVRGIYLWGGVGRGKTYLVDRFFSCLSFENKRRMHFQRFMHEVHRELTNLPKNPDPLPIVAHRFSQSVRLLCLDEFRVNDVADAMLMSGLLKALIDHHVVLVFTSNLQPDDLYLHGMQRDRFLPAIALIKENTENVYLDGATDYRLGMLEETPTLFTPAGKEADQAITLFLQKEIDDDAQFNQPISINNRTINTAVVGDGIVWFDFMELCGTARSASDYIKISEQFDTVILTNIIAMDEGSDDLAARFIQLIDTLYDHKVRLVASTTVTLDNLYIGQRKTFEFQRTLSRLYEMFSVRYQARKG